MSRRSRKGKTNKNLNPLPILIGMGIAIVAVIAVVLVMKIIKPSEPNAAPFPYENYFKNSKSMAGNTYSFEATISSKNILEDNGDTKLVVELSDVDDKAKPIAIFVKKEIREKIKKENNSNLDVSGTYFFTVMVSNKSFLEAISIRSK